MPYDIPEDEKHLYYTLNMRCVNCGWEGEIHYPKATTTQRAHKVCPNCECNSLERMYGGIVREEIGSRRSSIGISAGGTISSAQISDFNHFVLGNSSTSTPPSVNDEEII